MQDASPVYGYRYLLVLCLAIANSLAVSALYAVQALAVPSRQELDDTEAIAFVVSASLFGYSAGVACCAASSRKLSCPVALASHFFLLVAALSSASLASSGIILCLGTFLIGAGASLTQRLMTCATSLFPPKDRPNVIGFIVASGLLGIVVARATGMEATDHLGWRLYLRLYAMLLTFAAAAAVFASRYIEALPDASSTGRQELFKKYFPSLRGVLVKQALVFACYSIAWASINGIDSVSGARLVQTKAIIASAGLIAAIAAGRFCSFGNPQTISTLGTLAVFLACVALSTQGSSLTRCCLFMIVIDCGTQIALVANQSRAQRLATTVAERGRLAALVTIVSFIGGAVGLGINSVFQ